MRKITLLLGCLTCLALPAVAPAQIEEAQARFVPWSGYWWPHQDGGIVRPLRKYDHLTGHKAADWESKTYPSGPDVPTWHGYCHAWSASCIMEREPRKAVSPSTASGGASPLKLSVGDQKALLAACHAQDVANFYGQRNDGQEGVDPEDLRPDELWRLLKLYVKQQGVPLVLDLDAGTQVWNYPVYAYRVQLSPTGGSEDFLARMTIWLADDGVEPDFLGTKVRRESYQFTCKMRNGSVVMGSAKWVGPSVANHPDFAWYPYVAVAENPEMDHNLVTKLLEGGSEEARPRNAPYPPDEPEAPATPPSDPPAAENPRRVLALSSLELLALVANKTSSFNFDVTVDKFDGGEYTVGETYSIAGSSEKAGYLYLFCIAPTDPKKPDDLSLKLLFPLAGQDNRIPAKTRFTIPAAKDRFKFVAEEPPGVHVIKAIVTTRPLSITGMDRSQQGNREGGQGQRLRLPPAEQRQMQQVMRQVQQGKMKPEQVERWAGVKLDKLLGDFAQDEVPFYVGPKHKDKEKEKDKPEPKEKPKEKPKPDRG